MGEAKGRSGNGEAQKGGGSLRIRKELKLLECWEGTGKKGGRREGARRSEEWKGDSGREEERDRKEGGPGSREKGYAVL